MCADSSEQSLNTPWMPHTDGVFFDDNVQKLVLEGSIADIPFVVGPCSSCLVRVHEPYYALLQDLARTRGPSFPSPLSTSRELYEFVVHHSNFQGR